MPFIRQTCDPRFNGQTLIDGTQMAGLVEESTLDSATSVIAGNAKPWLLNKQIVKHDKLPRFRGQTSKPLCHALNGQPGLAGRPTSLRGAGIKCWQSHRSNVAAYGLARTKPGQDACILMFRSKKIGRAGKERIAVNGKLQSQQPQASGFGSSPEN